MGYSRAIISEHTASSIKVIAQATVDNKLTGCLSWSMDGGTLAAAGKQGVSLCGVGDGIIDTQLIKCDNYVLGVTISPDGKIIAYGGAKGILRLVDVQSEMEPVILRGHTNDISDIAYDPNGHLIASAGSWDASVILWDLATMSQKYTLETAERNSVLSVVFSKDGRYVYGAGLDNFIYVWDVNTGSLLKRVATSHSGGISTVHVRSDGAVLASGDMNGQLQLWDTSNFQPIRSFAAHSEGIWDVAFSSEGKLLASGGLLDDTVRLWNLDGIELTSIHERKTNALSVAFSPDDRLLAIAGDTNIIRLYGLEAIRSSAIFKVK